MDIRQLKYFLSVATHESLSKAALHLHIAQPALSRNIRMLEDELGVRLFERHLRGVTLTAEGRELVDRASYVVRSFDQLKADVKATQLPGVGEVAIGMTPNFAWVVGATLAKRVMAEYPGARLKIIEAYSPALRDMLLEGKIDIAVLSGEIAAPDQSIASEVLFEDQLCIIGGQDDPLLSVASLDIEQLATLPLVMTGMYSAGIRNEVETLASKKGLSLNVVVEVGSFALATQMIAQGLGYTIYVASGIHNVEGGPRLRAVPIEGLWLRRRLAWPLERPLSRLASLVLAQVRSSLLESVSSGAWRGGRLPHR